MTPLDKAIKLRRQAAHLCELALAGIKPMEGFRRLDAQATAAYLELEPDDARTFIRRCRMELLTTKGAK